MRKPVLDGVQAGPFGNPLFVEYPLAGGGQAA
jgi:hypothetical protein